MLVVYIIIGSMIAYSDFKKRIIPNNLILILGAVALLSKGFFSDKDIADLVIFLALNIVGILMFKYNILGAGDGKFFSVSWLCFQGLNIVNTAIVVMLLGGLYSIIDFFVLLARSKSIKKAISQVKRKTIPYGVAIYCGVVISVIFLGG